MATIRLKALVLAQFFGCLLHGAPAPASEEAFVHVSGMPPVEGDLRRSLTNKDAATGLTFTQDVYVLHLDALDVVTYVTAARCNEAGAAARPFIVALKYLPRKPQSFAAAGLHDIYKEVYVEDRDGRIRLYEDMSGRAMIELTRNYSPSCQGT